MDDRAHSEPRDVEVGAAFSIHAEDVDRRSVSGNLAAIVACVLHESAPASGNGEELSACRVGDAFADRRRGRIAVAGVDLRLPVRSVALRAPLRLARHIEPGTRLAQARKAVAVEAILPGEIFLDVQCVAAARLFQRQQAAAHGRDHIRLAADAPALCSRRWQIGERQWTKRANDLCDFRARGLGHGYAYPLTRPPPEPEHGRPMVNDWFTAARRLRSSYGGQPR